MNIEVTQPYLKIVQLDSVKPSKTNPRKTFNPAKLQELAESIAKHGLISPLLVRKTEDLEPFEIICGERRFRASRIAGIDQVSCLVYDELSDKACLEIQLIENAQREDVPPLEEAEGYSRLIEEYGYTFANLAKRVGKSEQHIAQRIKLMDLSTNAREALIGERIGIGHANNLARLTIDLQEQILEWLLPEWRGDKPTQHSIKDLEEYIERNVYRSLKDAPFSLSEKYLVPGVCACTECPKNSAAQKELFAELAGHAICTDSDCFDAKIDQHTKIRLIQLREGSTPGIAISTAYEGKPKIQALPSHLYKIVETKEPGAVQALAVDGQNKGRLVNIVVSEQGHKWLEDAAQPKDDEEPKAPKKSFEQQRKEEAERREKTAKLRTRMRLLLIEQITNLESGELTLEKLRLVLQPAPQWLNAHARRIFAQLCGVEEENFAKGVPKSYFEELDTLDSYFWACAAEYIANSAEAKIYDNSDLDYVQAGFAKLLGIDVDALKKQARQELKDEAKPAPAKKAKTKKAKTAAAEPEAEPEADSTPAPEKKKRGRPRKQK